MPHTSKKSTISSSPPLKSKPASKRKKHTTKQKSKPKSYTIEYYASDKAKEHDDPSKKTYEERERAKFIAKSLSARKLLIAFTDSDGDQIKLPFEKTE